MPGCWNGTGPWHQGKPCNPLGRKLRRLFSSARPLTCRRQHLLLLRLRPLAALERPLLLLRRLRCLLEPEAGAEEAEAAHEEREAEARSH